MAISDKELVYLFRQSYNYPHQGDYIFGQNANEVYKVIETNYFGDANNKCGLDAIIIEKQPGGEKAMIFVGSDQLEDWYTDFQLTNTGDVPIQYTAALEYYQQACIRYGIQMTVGGNSLGGGLANYVAVHNPGTISVTLNPAMLPEADNYFDQASAYNNITNYSDKGEVLHKVQNLPGGKVPGKIIEIESGVDSPYRIKDLHTGDHVKGINSASFVPNNLFTGSTLLESENIIINKESLECFSNEIIRLFKEISSNCYVLTNENINTVNIVESDVSQRQGTLKNTTGDFIATNFFTISQMLNNKFKINIFQYKPYLEYAMGPGAIGIYTGLGYYYIDLFKTISDLINKWGVTSDTIYLVLHSGNNWQLGTKISSLNSKLNVLYNKLDCIIDDIIQYVIVNAKGVDVAPSSIQELSELLRKRVIIFSQNVLRIAYIANTIGMAFEDADAACDNFSSDGINKDYFTNLQNIYLEEEVSKNGLDMPYTALSGSNLQIQSPLSKEQEDRLAQLQTEFNSFDNVIVEQCFNDAFDTYKENLSKALYSSMVPICDEIINMCNMLKQPNWHDENNEIYISVVGIADWTIDDDIQTASKDISLTKICSQKGIDINLLLDMLILVANDVKVNLDKIDMLVESVRETIRAMIFYPGEMEKINNNNKISYNTLKTIEIELNNSLNALDNFDSKSIKSKSITILKNRIREVIIPELQQLQIYYESISS